jgi:tetratricopeptide (TPR) repeat protein
MLDNYPLPMNESPAVTDFYAAYALLEQGHREEGLQALATTLLQHKHWLRTAEGRPVDEAIQVQRAFSLMHMQNNLEAKPLLEEATQFELSAEVRRDVHCHLGRCYHELGLYSLAKEQFERANALGVSEEWLPAFHYYYGYTLYELKEFQPSKREFTLCLQSGPSGPEAWLRYSMLAAACRKLGEHAEARAYEERAASSKNSVNE